MDGAGVDLDSVVIGIEILKWHTDNQIVRAVAVKIACGQRKSKLIVGF